jgi:hypothetical protein
MASIIFDGMEFGPEEIEDNRSSVIKLRDEALKQNSFGYAISLSHTIALLAELKRRVEAEPKEVAEGL